MTHDLTGMRFGRLVVLDKVNGSGRSRWNCVCDCGNTRTVLQFNLLRGLSKSCGCAAREKNTRHGMSGSPEYVAWQSMIARCTNPQHPEYEGYGGRGIAVCENWLRSFDAFFRDLGPRPTAAHSIDRINNEDGYRPGNVRWATGIQQNNNTRRNHIVVFRGEAKTVTEWRRITGITHAAIYWRMNHGWTDLEAVGLETRKSKADED